MESIVQELDFPLFAGMAQQERQAVLSCVGYRVSSFQKGDIIAFEGDTLEHIGIVLAGTVDMVKEDVWGNKTMLLRIIKGGLFGESFVCGDDAISTVTFLASEDARVMFMPFCRSMQRCANTCQCHQQMIQNMVRLIANKNRELTQKVEVVSKRTIREKLLAYLSIQAQNQQSRYVQIPLGRIELADYLCVDRSALTRELAKMKEEGILDFDRNCFRLL